MQTHIHIAHATINVNPGVALDAQFATAALASTEGLTPSPHPTMGETPPAAGEYWQGQGGHYICTLPELLGVPARHLIAAPASAEAEALKWGPYTDIKGASSQVNGPGNSRALLAAGDHPAAVHCSKYSCDGHQDFGLPARLDMVMAFICAPQLFSKHGYYWTSTQGCSGNAFIQDFEYGLSHWGYKDDTCRVRPVRWIPL
jgi:hypothetical protein